MLKTRVITAIVGLLISIFAIAQGGGIFNSVITILALLGWREFIHLARANNAKVPALWGYIVILASMVSLSFGAYALSAIILFTSIGVLYVMCTFSAYHITLHSVAYGMFGVLYVLIGMGALLLTRQDSMYFQLPMPFELTNWGTITIWLLLLCTWASDTFAYFVGSAIGKRKIVPHISPNKTLEGFIGGFCGCIITGCFFSLIVGIPVHLGLAVGIITGILAPLGDLFESKMKRFGDLKNSGVFLPGHGGVLDRFDSLLFAAPAVLLYLTLL